MRRIAFAAVAACGWAWAVPAPVWAQDEPRPKAALTDWLPDALDAAGGAHDLAGFGTAVSKRMKIPDDHIPDLLRFAHNVTLMAAAQLLGAGHDLDVKGANSVQGRELKRVLYDLRDPCVAGRKRRPDPAVADALLVVDARAPGAKGRWEGVLARAIGGAAKTHEVQGTGTTITQYDIPAAASADATNRALFVGWQGTTLWLASSGELAKLALAAHAKPEIRLLRPGGPAGTVAALPATRTHWQWAGGAWLWRQTELSIDTHPTKNPRAVSIGMQELGGVKGLTQGAAAFAYTPAGITDTLVTDFDPKVVRLLAMRGAPVESGVTVPGAAFDEVSVHHVDWTKVWPFWRTLVEGQGKLTGRVPPADVLDQLEGLYGEQVFGSFRGPVVSWSVKGEGDAGRVSRVRCTNGDLIKQILESVGAASLRLNSGDPASPKLYNLGQARLPSAAAGIEWAPAPWRGSAVMLHDGWFYYCRTTAGAAMKFAAAIAGNEGSGGIPGGAHSVACRRRIAVGTQPGSPLDVFRMRPGPQAPPTDPIGTALGRLRTNAFMLPVFGELVETADVADGRATLVSVAKFKG